MIASVKDILFKASMPEPKPKPSEISFTLNSKAQTSDKEKEETIKTEVASDKENVQKLIKAEMEAEK